jgi:Glycosyltransferase family 87
MSIESRTSFPPVELRAVVLTAAALVVFACSWIALHHGWFERNQIIDTPVYETYGEAMARGEVPYRDFSVEYPPGALPVFAAPALGNEGDADAFKRSFEALMVLCGVALVIALAFALVALGASSWRLFGALALAALAPLLLGSVVLTRFDLWPAALAAAALAAIVSGRFRLGHGLLGAAIVTKIWPGVLLPLTVAFVWRSRGRREGLVCLGLVAAVTVAVVAPFFVLAPHGVWSSFARQLSRPLQIESLGGALIVASHHVLGTGVTMVSSRGSQNIAGHAAGVLGWAQTGLQFAVLLALWITFASRRRTREELIEFSAAAVVAFVALGKVLSPQFMIWLIALIPLLRRWSAAGLFAVALVLTQAWFPQHYWDYALQFDSTVTWLVLARDLVLLALLAVLVVPMFRRARPATAR